MTLEENRGAGGASARREKAARPKGPPYRRGFLQLQKGREAVPED